MNQPAAANVEPIPGYRLIERLGRGGYGEVWKCEAPGGMHKAIKYVFGDMEGFGSDGQAAEQEYKSLNRVKTIRHPFILSIERFDIIDGQLLIVMELADRNLWDRFNECLLEGKQGIPHAELLRYMEEIAEALDLMNGHYQIQHLDIKPQNLFLVHNHVKVADFGLAKDLEGARADVTGGVTPTYAPPEAFDGWVSRHSDQYSLAIVYQEMLTGRRPFNGANTKQLILQHLTGTPDLSSLQDHDRDAVARALSKTPTDRFPTCTDFVKALRGQPTPPGAGNDGPTVPLAQMVTPRSTAKKLLRGAKTPPLYRSAGEFNDSPSRKLPSLVTPGHRTFVNLAAPVTKHRPLAPQTTGLPKSTTAPAERHGDGILFPALFIGLGGCGLRTLACLQDMVHDRFNQDRLPNTRWLAIDTDPKAVEAFLRDGRWDTEEVLLTRLQRPTHYLHRESLPNVETWLPNDSLYQIPRSHLTEGNRAFGRLALCDHYQIVCHRVRTALEAFMDPEGVLQADKVTKLGFRGNAPRVFLAGSLAGGTASGMMIDLAYIVRRELRQMGFQDGQVIGMMGLPPFRPSAGHDNARTALRELTHFENPASTFQVLFDPREQPLTDAERPFRRCHFVPAGDGGDGGRLAGERLAALLYAEAFTEAGRLGHPDGDPPATTSHCVSSAFRAHWPRHAAVRACADRLNRLTLDEWAAGGDHFTHPTLDPLFEKLWADRGLETEALRETFAAALADEDGRTPAAIVAEWLEPFRNLDKNTPADGEQVRAVIHRILDFVGRVGREEDEFPGRLAGALQTREKALVADADAKFITGVVSLIEQPGLRLPAADQLIRRLDERLTEQLEAADRKIVVADERVHDEYARLFSLLGMTVAANMSRLGKRAPAAEEVLQDVLAWVGRRVDLLILRRVLAVYRTLRANLPEYVREVQMCRAQLHRYAAQIPDGRGDGAAKPEADRMYFGAKAASLKEVADFIVGQLPHASRQELEQTLQAKIRHEGRSLVNMCVKSKEYGDTLHRLLADHAGRLLEPMVTAYAAGHATWVTGGDDLIDKAFELSGKTFAAIPGSVSPSLTVVGLPDGPAGEALLASAKEAAGNTAFAAAKTREELWVYRECRLTNAGSLFQPVSGSAAPKEQAGPVRHSRQDVPWPQS